MKPAVFLDRDGTINIEKDYLYKREEFEYTYGAVDALKHLYDAGFDLIIITNQSGIARGYYKESDYQKINNWMLDDLRSKGICITDTYFCPHHPEAAIKKYRKKCDCRKPELGLFYKAVKEHDINPDISFAIGDKLRDLSICKEHSVQGILICTQSFQTTDEEIVKSQYQKEIWKCGSLSDAAKMILEGEN